MKSKKGEPEEGPVEGWMKHVVRVEWKMLFEYIFKHDLISHMMNFWLANLSQERKKERKI